MTKTDLAWLGTTVLVWAHPDDETYLSGGAAAALVGQGQRVVAVTATRGEAGGPDTTPAARLETARIRTAELDRALTLLGVADHVWLDYEDGRCAEADAEPAVRRLVGLFDDVRPDTVVTFGPDGFTGHPDHRTVSRWVDLGAGTVRCLAPTAARRRHRGGPRRSRARQRLRGLRARPAAHLQIGRGRPPTRSRPGSAAAQGRGATGSDVADRGPDRGGGDGPVHRLGRGRGLRRPCARHR